MRFPGHQQREADRLRRWAHCQAEVSGTSIQLSNDILEGKPRRAVDTTKRLVEEAQSELSRLPVNKYSLAMQDVGDFLSNIVDQFAVAA